MTILPVGGSTVLLLLLGYCLCRRLHGTTRKQGDVHGVPEVEASAQDAEDIADSEAQPCTELALGSRPVARDGFVESMPRAREILDRVRASRLSPRVPRPKSLPQEELLSGRGHGMLSAMARKEVKEARDRARYPTGPHPGPDTTEPATTDSSANGFDSAQPAAPIDALASSTFQAPEHRLTDRSDGQVKIIEAVEADRALRSCRARASIRAAEAELDEMHVGAKGTKDGPGRSTSRGTLRPRPPTREGTPVDLFAGVRARRSAIQAAGALQAADALRELSSRGGSLVRV